MKRLGFRLVLVFGLIFATTPSAFGADTQAPVLVNWKLIDEKADISTGDASVKVEFSISDDSEIDGWVILSLRSKSTSQSTGLSISTLISKVGKVSTYQATASIGFGQAPGEWGWALNPLRDSLGNSSNGFGPGGNWPVTVWVYDKDFTESKRLSEDKAAAKAAAELKAKQDADAKSAAELKAKQDADAKAAAEKSSLNKAQNELAEAKTALADSQKVNREQAARIISFEQQFKVLSESVATVQNQLSQLNSKLAAALSGLNTANAKIKKICAAKPKPKGC